MIRSRHFNTQRILAHPEISVKFSVVAIVSAIVVLSSARTVAQAGNIATPDHVASVRRAQRSEYAVASSSNGCPMLDSDINGWPSKLIRKCLYSQGSGTHLLKAIVYLLDVQPEAIATWIETTCASQMPNSPKCFSTILECGRLNSGMMFPIDGNLVENSKKLLLSKRYDRVFWCRY
jgi:hypothetical protein